MYSNSFGSKENEIEKFSIKFMNNSTFFLLTQDVDGASMKRAIITLDSVQITLTDGSVHKQYKNLQIHLDYKLTPDVTKELVICSTKADVYSTMADDIRIAADERLVSPAVTGPMMLISDLIVRN